MVLIPNIFIKLYHFQLGTAEREIKKEISAQKRKEKKVCVLCTKLSCLIFLINIKNTPKSASFLNTRKSKKIG